MERKEEEKKSQCCDLMKAREPTFQISPTATPMWKYKMSFLKFLSVTNCFSKP